MRPKLYLVPGGEQTSDYYEESPPKFSDRHYAVPASNEMGQSWPVGASIMLDENRIIEEIVESGKIRPWKTKADFMRWAIHEGLKQIRGELPFISSDLGRVEALMEYLGHEERRSQFIKFFDKVDRAVQGWLDVKADGEAKKLISNIAERVRSEFSQPEDEWLRHEVEKRLSKYTGLFELEDTKGAYHN